METVKKVRKVSIFEIIWYTICGLLALWGLTYIVLGLIAQFSPMNSINDSPMYLANEAIKSTFGLGFTWWGIIIFAIAIFLTVIVLLIFSRKADREYEKQQRRAARLASYNANKNEAPVNEAPKAE